MKKLLLTAGGVIVAAGVVVGGANAVDNHYQEHKHQKQVQQTNLVVSAKQAQYQADKTRVELVTTQNAALQLECQKGVAAYAKLSPALKAQTPVPQCTPPVAQ